MYKSFLKRFIDFSAALLGLILLSPIMLVLIICLFFANKGKPFFLQNRPGKNGENFSIIKFKSMTDKKDGNGQLLPDIERMTTLGTFVRKTSLDEIPQLINVLKGEMSLIGPRPLLPKYIPLYSSFQKRRHEVRPGITGWAQVNGRNSISWAKKFELDVYYVDHVSFFLDFKIIFLTLIKVIKKEGVNQDSSRPMQPFNGKN